MFLVSVTWLKACSIVAYGLSKVPGLVLEPSVDTTSNAEVSITLSSNSAGPGVAVMVTVPSLAGVNVAVASLFTTVTLELIVPDVALKSKAYSGIIPPRVIFSLPFVPTNFTFISAVVPIYTVSTSEDNSTTVQLLYNELLTRVVLGFSLLPQKL